MLGPLPLPLSMLFVTFFHFFHDGVCSSWRRATITFCIIPTTIEIWQWASGASNMLARIEIFGGCVVFHFCDMGGMVGLGLFHFFQHGQSSSLRRWWWTGWCWGDTRCRFTPWFTAQAFSMFSHTLTFTHTCPFYFRLFWCMAHCFASRCTPDIFVNSRRTLWSWS